MCLSSLLWPFCVVRSTCRPLPPPTGETPMPTRTQVLSAIAIATLPTLCSAAVVTFKGASPDNGTGFGSILNILSLQNRPEESGSVIRQSGADVLTGDATNTSQT